MKVAKHLASAIFMFAIFTSESTADEPSSQHRPPIEMQLKISHKEQGVVLLEIELSYVSAVPITIYES